MKSRISSIVMVLLLALSCSQHREGPLMSPDYRDVTVPCNIAPLNFHYCGAGPFRTEFSAGGVRCVFRGRNVRWREPQWRRILEAACGDTIRVKSSVCGGWTVAVSRDSIDGYLTYRLIEPAYEVWDRVEVRERRLDGFDERVLSDWRHTGNSCMNCHVHKGANSIFYIRGPKGGALLNRGGKLSKLDLKAEGMVSSTVYGDLHPGGRWGVFSVNRIIPGLHTSGNVRMEVFDSASDLVVADFDNNRFIAGDALASPGKLETFPCFSADGKSVFYCVADSLDLPRDIRKLRYSIVRAAFDDCTGLLGNNAVTVWESDSSSACHPKASPDGKWLMFTVADYGTFPIWHGECDLCLLDMETSATVDMSLVNSDVSDSYHSWSSNSRWFVFASKRGDGMYGKPYICHIDAQGRCGKPFVLPQSDPYHYEKMLKSYNIPDLGIEPCPYDAAVSGSCLDTKAIGFEVFSPCD